MSLITRMRKETAVWFEKTGTDPYGKPTHGVPVEIKVRWDAVSKQFIKPTGEEVMSNAIVYVDRDVKVGDVLLLGTIADNVTNPLDAKDNVGAWEVQRFDRNPNLRATEYLRTAYL